MIQKCPETQPFVEDKARADDEPAWWSLSYPPPPIGTPVKITAWETLDEGTYRTGTVVGYTISHGWLMINVRPDSRPLWHLVQNPERSICLFAGRELDWVR
jgi:hypothetical protein